MGLFENRKISGRNWVKRVPCAARLSSTLNPPDHDTRSREIAGAAFKWRVAGERYVETVEKGLLKKLIKKRQIH